MSEITKLRIAILAAIVVALFSQFILGVFLHITASSSDFHDPETILGADLSAMNRSELERISKDLYSGLVKGLRGFSKVTAVLVCLLTVNILILTWLLFRVGGIQHKALKTSD